MSLLSRFGQPDDPEFHSHAMARATQEQAQTIGSTDNSTFQQRLHLERNRQHVGGYHSSGVLNNYKIEAQLQRTLPLRNSVTSSPRIDIVRSAPRPSLRVASRPIQTSFREPPHKFNPYA